ncbi:chemotaxis-specific protein-glutamate methyltransferase CheB [Alteromonas sp. P256]|uniref:chemotaxis-specific protein-glutamate methyltransferase CheB n=1 Tax=Alteromonas sp. P256 TaxID=3117399 RepID=UPI002FE2505C
MPIKVLIVDDSALMRKHFSNLFIREGFVVDIARNGEEALSKAVEFQPDCITLDINMPVMDGMTCLAILRDLYSCPIIMVSSLTQKGALVTLEALTLGAADFVLKTGGTVSRDIADIEAPLIDKIHALTDAVKPVRAIRKVNSTAAPVPHNTSSNRKVDVVLIGVSTGGPKKLEQILTQLSPQFPAPIVIAQHMPASFTSALSSRLDGICPLPVMEAGNKTKLKRGCVYIAKGDSDVVFSKSGQDIFIRPVPSSPSFLWHPSVDRMVESALSCYEPMNMVCVQLTGMGYDGVQAMSKAFKGGAITIAESEKSAVVFGMPKELIEAGCASFTLDSHHISGKLNALCR